MPTGTMDNAARLLNLINAPMGLAGIGNLRQALNESSPARSNADWFGPPIAVQVLVATEKGTTVAIPVQPGDIISKIILPIGKTTGKKVEKAYAALYSGKAAASSTLLAQSKEANLAEGVVKEKPVTFTLETAITISAANAPNGFVYAQFAAEGETMPDGIGWSVSAEAQASIAAATAKAVPFLSAKASKALKGTADAKLGESEAAAAVATVPMFILL